MTEVPGTAGDVLPGDVVRDLFERHEQEIESLLADLTEARREADAAEEQVRAHPAFGLLGADEAERLLPTAVIADPVEPAVDADGRPRTTVVNRHRPTPAAGAVQSVPPSGPGATAPPSDIGSPTERSRASRLVTSHWVWKVGVVLTVTALLLLKFG
jgi:hypothetical protein